MGEFKPSPFVISLRRRYKAVPQKTTYEQIEGYLGDGVITLEEFNYIVE